MRLPAAMTFREASVEDVEQFIKDPMWVMEQKLDGTRCLVRVLCEEPGQGPIVTFSARTGAPLKHAAAAVHFERLTGHFESMFTGQFVDVTFDGELMFDTGIYHIFDLPFMAVSNVVATSSDRPYVERRAVLEEFASSYGLHYPIRLVDSHGHEDAKRRLAQRVREIGGEGVMVKHRAGKYEAGKRSNDGLKLKFVRTADVIVTSFYRDRNAAGREIGNIQFGVHNSADERIVPLGSCSIIGKPEVKVGDVIEVKYLSYVYGGSLVQPRMTRVRDDKRPQDCTTDQLQMYSKEVV